MGNDVLASSGSKAAPEACLARPGEDEVFWRAVIKTLHAGFNVAVHSVGTRISNANRLRVPEPFRPLAWGLRNFRTFDVLVIKPEPLLVGRDTPHEAEAPAEANAK